MKKVAVVTATRAEYGILRPLLRRLKEETEIDLQLLVTGTHLSEKYGRTQDEILQDGMEIYRKIPILENGNTPYDISITMANAIRGFAAYFREEKPHLLVVLGDRTELLGICSAAMNEQIPIAHLHGGELTEGAVDDCVRHAITKMSYLHFPTTEIYRRRIIQMGEEPKRVFAVGALGVENILSVPLFSYEQICEEAGIPLHQKYVVVTFHPVTLEMGAVKEQVQELIEAMERKEEYFYLITKANADVGGEQVNHMFADLESQRKNVRMVSSLGMKRYLSAVKYSEFVMGNSSSGVIEAPALGTPTVNIGNRQKGRIMAETVISCEPKLQEILWAMEKAERLEHQKSKLFGDGHTSEKIVIVIKEFLKQDHKTLQKVFYDLNR